MLNLNGITAIEQAILVIAALLVAWVVFKILAGLLRIVLIVAIVACLWVFVLQPTLMKDAPEAKLPAEVSSAANALKQCLQQTSESECKRRAMAAFQ